MSDLDYLRRAYQTAAVLGTDPSTQNGAILVNASGKILVEVGNNLPYGVKESPERWQRPLKYSFVEHAERNAIFHAARRGISTSGLTMYCPWAPCADCARAIVQSGICTLITHDWDMHRTQVSWLESVAIGLAILKEGGVLYHSVPGKIGGVKIRFAGQWEEP